MRNSRSAFFQASAAVLLAGALLCLAGCARRVTTPAANAAMPFDNSFMDLQPGGKLRIVLPVTAIHNYRADAAASSGTTLTLRSSGPVGYDVAFYTLDGKPGGKVRLRLTGFETSRDGKTRASDKARALPFPLPTKAAYLRLIYLTRSSEADHNMAIAAARKREELSAFTTRLKADPRICIAQGAVFCTWVPAGTAVRPD